MKTSKKIALLACSSALALSICGCSSGDGQEGTKDVVISPDGVEEVESKEDSKGDQGKDDEVDYMSSEAFSKIVPGMTYDEAISIIGSEGTPIIDQDSSTPEIDGDYTTYQSYVWMSSDEEGTVYSVVFEDGAVKDSSSISQ